MNTKDIWFRYGYNGKIVSPLDKTVYVRSILK